MPSFIGNRIQPAGRGLIPPGKVIKGEYRSVIGNGVGLFTIPTDVIADFDDADFTNASERWIDYQPGGSADDPLIGPFAGGTPAIVTIGGRRFMQLETARDNTCLNNATPIDDWGATRASWDPVPEFLDDEMGKLVEDTTLGANHRAEIVGVTTDGSSVYCFSMYVKTNGRSICQLYTTTQGFPGAPAAKFDLDIGEVTQELGILDAGIYLVKDGIYRIWFTVASDIVGTSRMELRLANELGNTVYNGDGVSGMYCWGGQIEIGNRPSSPIRTVATPVARAKDQLQWEEASVPSALRGKVTAQVIPRGDQDTAGLNRVVEFAAAGGGASNHVAIYYVPASKLFRVWNFTVTGSLVDSDALTFSANQVLTITWDPTEGSIEVSGATTGNGKNTGTGWSTTAGLVSWGMSYNALGQFGGIISEPYSV